MHPCMDACMHACMDELVAWMNWLHGCMDVSIPPSVHPSIHPSIHASKHRVASRWRRSQPPDRLARRGAALPGAAPALRVRGGRLRRGVLAPEGGSLQATPRPGGSRCRLRGSDFRRLRPWPPPMLPIGDCRRRTRRVMPCSGRRLPAASTTPVSFFLSSVCEPLRQP